MGAVHRDARDSVELSNCTLRWALIAFGWLSVGLGLVGAWHRHRVISRCAKVLATAMMATRFLFVTHVVPEDWVLLAVLASLMGPAALYIFSRASAPSALGRAP